MVTLAQQTAGTGASPLDQVAPFLFFGFAGLTVLSAWAIVVSQNIVRMSVYLLLTLGGAAGLYFMLSAELLAAIQLIVYAGGTLILIVFGVMLTNRSPFNQLKAKSWETAVGAAIGGVIAGLLVLATVASLPLHHYEGPLPQPQGGAVPYIGKTLLTAYVVPFEVAAVLLLVVMIGAAYMARRRAK